MDSCSFIIGDNTLLEIEKQARRFETPKTSKKSQEFVNNEEKSVIIEESPNSHLPHQSVFFKSLRNRSNKSSIFEKSKSASILQRRENPEISSISKYLTVEDVDFSAWEKSAAELISPMVQKRVIKEETKENCTDYINLKLDCSESQDDNYDDTVMKPVEVDVNPQSQSPFNTQDFMTEDPLDTAIAGDIELSFTEKDLESSVRNSDHITFIQPCDNAENTQETQDFIDDILEEHKTTMKTQKEIANESVFDLVSFSTQTGHEKSLKIDSTKDLRLLSSWNLPKSIVNEYKKKNVIEMFDWQVECLQNSKVLFEGANLVYSAPTSAGKTLVSEILMIKSIVERKKKSLFILPFVSVVREKMFYLQVS